MIPVKPHIAESAHVKSLAEYQEMYRRSIEEPVEFWREMSGIVDWFAPPRNIVDVDMEEVDFAWYRRRPPERLLQLRRPPSAAQGRADGHHLGR